jgi:hypothetical protein
MPVRVGISETAADTLDQHADEPTYTLDRKVRCDEST